MTDCHPVDALFMSRWDKIQLDALLQKLTPVVSDSSVGLVYTPSSCQFVRCRNRQWQDWRGASLKVQSVFEARIFTSDAELRWLLAPERAGHVGRACLLTERDGVDLSSCAPDGSEKIQGLQRYPNRYLLWGRGWSLSERRDEMAGGWSCLAEGRIGTLYVPLAGVCAADQRVQMKTLEYLQTDSDYGNTHILAERLVELALFQPEKDK